MSGGAVGKMADMEFQRHIAEPATARASADESQWRCRREEWWTLQLLTIAKLGRLKPHIGLGCKIKTQWMLLQTTCNRYEPA
jgi:hypothetical protein